MRCRYLATMGCAASQPADAETEVEAEAPAAVEPPLALAELPQPNLAPVLDEYLADGSKAGLLSATALGERRVGSIATQRFPIGATGYMLRYAMMSQCGSGSSPSLSGRFVSSTLATQGGREALLLGILDGHGTHGARCAAFAHHLFADELARQLLSCSGSYQQACFRAHIELNSRMGASTQVDAGSSGTSALTAFFSGALPNRRATLPALCSLLARYHAHRARRDRHLG